MDRTQAVLGELLRLVERQVAGSVDLPRVGKRVPGRRPKALNSDEVARLVGEYERGVAIEDLVTTYGCHRATVLKYTAEAGVHRPKKYKVAPEQLDEIIRLYGTGVGTGEIGRRLGFTTKTVRRRLKTAGMYRPEEGA